MDCSNVAGLTVSEAAKCAGSLLAPMGARLSTLTLGELGLMLVSVAIAPAVFASVGPLFTMIGRMYDRVVRSQRFVATKHGDSVRHRLILWFMISGAVGFVAGAKADNGLIGLAGLWLLCCSAFFIVSGRVWWGDIKSTGVLGGD